MKQEQNYIKCPFCGQDAVEQVINCGGFEITEFYCDCIEPLEKDE